MGDKVPVSGGCQTPYGCKAGVHGRTREAIHLVDGRRLCQVHSPYDDTTEHADLYGWVRDTGPVTVSLQFPVPGHGAYKVRVEALDVVMARYLPGLVMDGSLVRELKERINERSDAQGGGIDYSDLTTVTECLLVLAEYDGYGL